MVPHASTLVRANPVGRLPHGLRVHYPTYPNCARAMVRVCPRGLCAYTIRTTRNDTGTGRSILILRASNQSMCSLAFCLLYTLQISLPIQLPTATMPSHAQQLVTRCPASSHQSLPCLGHLPHDPTRHKHEQRRRGGGVQSTGPTRRPTIHRVHPPVIVKSSYKS